MNPFIPLPELLQCAAFKQRLLQVYGHDLMATRLPVLASQWSKYYFMQWWPAILGPWLKHGLTPSLRLEHAAMAFDERGLPRQVRVEAEGTEQVCLEAIITLNLQPFITQVAAITRVPIAVLWGNAGDSLERAVGALPLAVAGPAQRLMSLPTQGCGRRNPLYQPVRYLADGARQTRICCLACTVQWIGHCEHCPLK